MEPIQEDLHSLPDARLPKQIQFHYLLTRNLLGVVGKKIQITQHTIEIKSILHQTSPKFLFPANHLLSLPFSSPLGLLKTPFVVQSSSCLPSAVRPTQQSKDRAEAPFLDCVSLQVGGAASVRPAACDWGTITLTWQAHCEGGRSWNSSPSFVTTSSIFLPTAISRQQNIVESWLLVLLFLSHSVFRRDKELGM